MLLQAAQGVRIEPLHDTFAAYSPASGETLQLNAEAAAVVELLQEMPRTAADVCAALADDTDLAAAEIEAALRDVWSLLLDAGLIVPAAGRG